MNNNSIIGKLIGQYNLSGNVEHVEKFGNGRINKTYKLTTKNGKIKHYLLQQINIETFKNPSGLMKNIEAITSHLKNKIKARGGDSNRETLTIIKNKNGETYTFIDGFCFRIYQFIENGICKDSVSCEKDMSELGKAFGIFHKDLQDFDAKSLSITIPNFHNTLKRYNTLFETANENKFDRLKNVSDEIEFVQKNKKIAGLLYTAEKVGLIPIRTVHNDPKLNNVMFDEKTGNVLCILDLDTIMPNTLCYDFGDAIRYACNTASEDETDLSKVKFNFSYFKAFTSAYLKEMKNALTEKEKQYLYIAPKTLAFELGIRFLQDYLAGDVYFSVEGENDNLNRARVQFKLMKEIIKHENRIKTFIQKCLN